MTFITHQKSRTVEYRIWSAMKARCQNPKSAAYKHYGERGITVCERWQKFENFIVDMGERPDSTFSLERKDVNSGYSPDNCVWATIEVQQNNTRNNKPITFKNRTQNLAQWARELNISPRTISYRLDRGWDIEKVLTPKRTTFAQQCRNVGIKVGIATARLKRGWDQQDAFSLSKFSKGKYKFTDEQVEQLKEYRKTHSIKETYTKFGCSKSQVLRIVRGTQRKHKSVQK